MQLVQRLVWGVVVMWLAATLVFFALRVLPSDAIAVQMMDSGASDAEIDALRAEQGLTDALLVQYGRFMGGLLRGDFGVSLLSGQPVSELIGFNLGATVSLTLAALGVAVIIGLGVGLAAGANAGLIGRAGAFITNLALSTPVYWTGTLLIYVFTVQLALLPPGGGGRLSQLIMPAAVLGFHTAGAIARVVAQEVWQLRNADFVRVARAKGLPERRVLLTHIVRAGIAPVIAVIALQAGFLFSGVVVTETLFNRPGLGRLLLDATMRQDYPIVQGVVVLAALVYTLLNVMADVLVRLLDPRVQA
jgi:ABC-type dipeptide/oligopeptide/nickel transport system permease component